MYFCGPTVYQRIHIGNARPFVISLWLKRWLERSGYEVTLVENITDINDKIYLAAPGDSARLAADASGWYVEDTGDLGLGRPDVEPKATETIPEIVALIEELVGAGHAYPAGGDVYFRVSSFPDYGRLSGRHGDEEATRNPSEEDEEEARKEDPRDFALWKGHKEGEDTWWESPWGRGRPGWHIECSAMAEAHLGPVFEIHGGGIDLVFPHHENEVAQSRSLGHEFARLWMHNGMLRLAGEKMSKSLGNIVSLREALDEWGRETLLVYFLGGHWRKPIDYSDEVLESARASKDRLREVFRSDWWRELDDWITGLDAVNPTRLGGPEPLVRVGEVNEWLEQMLIAATNLRWHPGERPSPEASVGKFSTTDLWKAHTRWAQMLPPRNVHAEEAARFDWGRFLHEVNDDFNLPAALRHLRRWGRARKLGLLYAALAIFGLDSLAEEESAPPPLVVQWAVMRRRARREADFEEADELRALIASSGWEVRDVDAEPGFRLVPRR